MNFKKSIFYSALYFAIFVLSTPGQTSSSKITLNAPPANAPTCNTRFNTVGNSIFYEVVVPASFKPGVSGNTVEGELENDNIVFSFLLKKDGQVINKKGNCEATLTEFKVTLTPANSTAGGNITGNSGGTIPPASTSTPIPASNLTPTVSNKQEEEAKEKALDLSIPESPGFTILGLTPQEVTRPATPREFATSIINSIDRNGNLQSGIAIDTAPYQLLVGNSVTHDKYTEKSASGYLTRFLWRTQFSLATTKGTTESDKSARIGTGLNLTFFDNGDVDTDEVFYECRMALNRELIAQSYRDLGVDPRAGRLSPEIVNQVLARRRLLINEAYLQRYEKCSEEAKKRNFGKSSFGVGIAGSWISKNGDSSKFTNNGQGLWASLAYGFEGIPGLSCTEDEITDETNRCIKPQLIFHFRRRIKENVPNPSQAGMFTTKDSNLFGMRLRVGVPTWAVNFEGVYRAERYAGRTSSSNIEASFGADYKLAKNLYLNFSIGGETKESNIPNTGKVFVRTSFNWGASQKPLN